MRGIETGKVRIRHEVFTEIARLAYEGGDYAKRLEELPFKIIPGEIGTYRDSLFLERAVVGDRLRFRLRDPRALRARSTLRGLESGAAGRGPARTPGVSSGRRRRVATEPSRGNGSQYVTIS